MFASISLLRIPGLVSINDNLVLPGITKGLWRGGAGR